MGNSRKSTTTDQAKSLSSSTAGMASSISVGSIIANPTIALIRPVLSLPAITSALATSRNGLSSFYHLANSVTLCSQPRPGSWIMKRRGESTLLGRSSGSSTRNPVQPKAWLYTVVTGGGRTASRRAWKVLMQNLST